MDTFFWLLVALGVGFLAYLLYSRQFGWLLGVAANSALGIAGLLIFNAIFHGFGLAVGINALTVLVVGVLGAPGFLLLYVTQVLVR